jgi:hypothetical protein
MRRIMSTATEKRVSKGHWIDVGTLLICRDLWQNNPKVHPARIIVYFANPIRAQIWVFVISKLVKF